VSARATALVVGFGLACAATPVTPGGAPIPQDLLCALRSEPRSAPSADAADAPYCLEVVRPRVERLKRRVLAGWRGDQAGVLQVEFSLDPAGKPVNACAVGGTNGDLARELIAAIEAYEPTEALSADEVLCFAGAPLVATFSLERH